MRIPKHDIPTKVSAPGAEARLLPDFGTTAPGSIGAEYFTMAAGTDLAPLLEGLPGDMCDAAHWGYMIDGTVVLTFADGSTETCRGGDVFHWPAHHSLRVEDDAEIILFSELTQHAAVMDHINSKLAAAT